MTSEYESVVEVDGAKEFFGTLEGEITVSQSFRGADSYHLMEDVDPDMAVEYLEAVVDGEAEGSATPWLEYEGSGLLDPGSLQPWDNLGDSYRGELHIKRQNLTENGVSGKFNLLAEDGNGDEVDIDFIFEEEDYKGKRANITSNAYFSQAFEELGL